MIMMVTDYEQLIKDDENVVGTHTKKLKLHALIFQTLTFSGFVQWFDSVGKDMLYITELVKVQVPINCKSVTLTTATWYLWYAFLLLDHLTWLPCMLLS